ncbi:MAG: hypothetical protein R3F20_00010 [Planctomycetota bacterium]
MRLRCILCFALALILAATILQAQDAPVAAPAWQAVPPVGGKLEEKDGTKILYLWGSPEERGFAEGYLLGEIIFKSVDEFALSRKVLPNPALWDAVVRPLVAKSFVFDDEFKRWSGALHAGISRRLEGKIAVAKLGRDLQADDLVVCSCIPDLAGFLCSSFSAWGELTPKDAFIVGRNLDYFGTPTMTENSLVKVNAAAPGRAAWVGVGWPGIAGCLTGVSERGVWLALHDVAPRKEQSDLSYTSRVLALEEIIETVDPAGDPEKAALAVLRARRFSMGGNGMLAWCAGLERGAVVLEFDGERSKSEGANAREPVKGVPFICCSNHHRLRSEDGHDCWRYARLAKGGEKTDRGRLDLAAGWDLIRSSSVKATIYRCVADLATGRLEVERRLRPGEERWSKRLSVDVDDLLAEVRRAAAPAEAVPAGAGAK